MTYLLDPQGRSSRRVCQLYNREIKSLLVVAPPRALGVLRDKFPASLQAIVTAELAKDLVRLPTGEIERHLAG
jgi:protein required for attachment to host cells